MRRTTPFRPLRVENAASVALVLGLVLSLLLALRPAPAQAASFPSSELIVTLRGESPYRLHPLSRAAVIHGVVSRMSEDPDALRLITSGTTLSVLSFDDPSSAQRALRELRSDPDVLAVEPNVTREVMWEPVEDGFTDQLPWIERVNATTAWDITTGTEEVVVAVLDTGVSTTHPDLADRLVEGFNAVDGSTNTADIDGHGTHVAGIIAAGDNGVGTAGVAMDVRIMPVRILSDDGEISVADEIEGIYWAVDNGADIINMSLGGEEYIQAERDAVVYAVQHGVPVIAASGNSFNKYNYPANYEESISVGSMGADGNPSSFTSRLTRVDLAAPGESIYSPGWDAFYGDYWDEVFYSSFKPVSGTSFSTAIVSGAVALMKSVDPNLSPEQARGILTATAVDGGSPGRESGTGAGLLNVEGAVRETVFSAMQSNWQRTDGPVAGGAVTRTWLWGAGRGQHAYEVYEETRHGVRLVYYFDKSRMEVTNPLDDRGNPWYVTNGLLVTELVTGRMQLGDSTFEDRAPAEVNVAGDPDDTTGPTYAAFRNVLNSPAIGSGETILLTIDRNGRVNADANLGDYGVTAAHYVADTNHRVASVFWEYLNSTGIVANGEELAVGRLFDPWFYATGYPITEAYWSRVKVAGVVQDVLIQCFERRCLTYTPNNAPGWEVEMGNVGLHYYTWRYGASRSTAEVSDGPKVPNLRWSRPRRFSQHIH